MTGKKGERAITRTAGLLGQLAAANVARFGVDAPAESGGEAGGPIGLPLPSLALEVLFGSSALQLGRVFGIVGRPQSFKTMLALELGKIVAAHGGITSLCETEGGKISSGIVASVYGDLVDRLDVRSVTSVEKAQELLAFAVDWLMERHPERDVLLALVLDSLNGPSSEVRQRSISEKGHASRDFPIEAFLWSKFITDIAVRIAGWPVVFILTNHLKRFITTNGTGTALRLPGGDAQLFYAAAYLQLERGSTVERSSQLVTRLIATRIKPVLAGGPPVLEIPVVVDLEDGGRIYFDWHHATAHLLAQPLVYPGLREVVDVSASGRSILSPDRRFTCRQLGLVAAPADDLAAAVQGDAVLMDELRRVFGVVKLATWSGAMPPGDAVCDQPERGTASDDEPDSPWAQMFGEW